MRSAHVAVAISIKSAVANKAIYIPANYPVHHRLTDRSIQVVFFPLTQMGASL